jgi:hypothetical protein
MAQPAWTNWNRVKKELISMWKVVLQVKALPKEGFQPLTGN